MMLDRTTPIITKIIWQRLAGEQQNHPLLKNETEGKDIVSWQRSPADRLHTGWRKTLRLAAF